VCENKENASKKKRKLVYKYNWKNAFLQLRKRIVELLSRESLEKILETLVAKRARKLVVVKKGRKSKLFNFETRKINQKA